MSFRQALLIVWVAAGVHGYLGLNRGWVPHDEGQLFQSASRTVSGEMPHRDFDEMYTGGLTYLHGVALRYLGETMMSLRLVLFAVYMLWIPVVFYVAAQFGTPTFAASVSALAAVWSVPNYPAAVPSWYNLFLAVFGVASVVRFLDTRRNAWLVAAGLCGGLSFVVKIVGLYCVAGIMLFLLLHEQNEAWGNAQNRAARSKAYSILVAIGLGAFLSAIVAMVRPTRDLSGWLLFVVPSGAVVWALLLRELRVPPGSFTQRARSLSGLMIPFLAGVAIPIGLFILLFAISGGARELFHALFVASRRRLEFASYPSPQFDVLLCVPMMLVVIAMWRLRAVQTAGTLLLVIGSWLLILFVYSASRPVVYQLAWRPLVFLLALLGVSTLLHLTRESAVSGNRQKAFLLFSVSATCSLVQFPFPAPIYFCYVAPLVALSMAAAPIAQDRPPHAIAGLLLGFYVLFAVFRVTPAFINDIGRFYSPDRLSAGLTMPSARGIRVFPEEATRYERIIHLVSQHAKGRPIYAFPDAPEIYVLSGLPNPTRTIYEFLADPPISDATMIETIIRHDVRVVVINRAPQFSGDPSGYVLRELHERFPNGETIDNFEVRWRE